jgi:hypothetical protein
MKAPLKGIITGVMTEKILKKSGRDFRSTWNTFQESSFFVPMPVKNTRGRFNAQHVYLFEDVERMIQLFVKELDRARR